MEPTDMPELHLGDARLNTEVFSVSDTGDLIVTDSGTAHNIPDLVRAYASPLELFLPNLARKRVREVVDTFNAEMKTADYGASFSYHYPMKVNQRKEFVSTVIGAGAQIETSSHNELVLVRRFLDEIPDPKNLRILSNGPKTRAYIERIRTLHDEGFAIMPIIEDESELKALQSYTGPVGIRVDLDLKVDSHWDHTHNRFGFSEVALRELEPIPNLTTLSYHISSQIEALEGFTEPLVRAVALYADLKKKNPLLSTINIGGGAGIPYGQYPAYTTQELIRAVVATCKLEAVRHGVSEPNIICEWGRHVVAPAQVSLFTIIGEKEIVNGSAKKWYVLDGSFIAHLPDTWSIKQRWHITPATHMLDSKSQTVWFAGSSCDSDDEYKPEQELRMPLVPVQEDRPLIVAVYDTGAYQNSLASYHCLLSQPLQIMIDGDTVTVLRGEDTASAIGARFGWN